jgi:ABC-type polysaccharide/polyol phosphate transport system ATPase subunit
VGTGGFKKRVKGLQMSSKKNVIKVENLSKCYNIYNRPQDRFKQFILPRLQKTIGQTPKIYYKEFWALRDVSFEVQTGETIGIVGRNGSGKSTLLQMICGTLTPTYGSVETKGRIAALLELGSGFNPQFTGHENIYMNAAILGLTKKEIDAQYNDIVAFADIGDFINQPVKFYSSGMVVRLAFAVQAQISPDILVVDEALAVGDIRFQNKSIRKMEAIQKSGTTILFVSHDLQTISKFCDRVIWLDDGKIKQQGSTKDVLENFSSWMSYGMQSDQQKEKLPTKIANTENETLTLMTVKDQDSFGEKQALIIQAGFLNQEGRITTSLIQGEWVTFICKFVSKIDLNDIAIGVLFKNRLNLDIMTFNSYMYDAPLKFVPANKTVTSYIKFKVPKIRSQQYLVTIALSEGTQLKHTQQHWIHSALTVNVISDDILKASSIVTPFNDEISFEYKILEQ